MPRRSSREAPTQRQHVKISPAKPKRAHGERDKRTTRSQRWLRSRDHVYEQFQELTTQRQALIAAHQFSDDQELYIRSLWLVVLRLKMGTETWIRVFWNRLARQLKTSDIPEVTRILLHTMTQPDNSCIYRLIHTLSASTYVGIVHSRPATKRYYEHVRGITTDLAEDKYKLMRRNGGASQWLFVPMVLCEGIVPHRQLEMMEQLEIRATPHCINMHYKGRNKPVVAPQKKNNFRTEAKPTRVVQLDCFERTADGSWFLSPDLKDCFANNLGFAIHSSRLVCIPTELYRLFKTSTIRGAMVEDPHRWCQGSLRQTIKWAHHNPGWISLTILIKRKRHCRRPQHYLTLVDIAASNRTAVAASTLNVADLYRLWYISRRTLGEKLHIINDTVVKGELKHRGIRCMPEQDLAIVLPPDSRLDKITIRRTMSNMLQDSFLDNAIVVAMMWNIRIAYQRERTLGSLIINAKLWIKLRQDNKIIKAELPCSCKLYPNSWPRRHRHIFYPSWEYKGPFFTTIRQLMPSKVKSQYDPTSLRKTLRKFWCKHLPAALQISCEVPEQNKYTPSIGPLSYTSVKNASSYLEDLVTMGIDKCTGRALILCPVLFDKIYSATFPVETDTVHFERVNLSPRAYGVMLKTMYITSRWSKIATWHDGSPPVPYPLFKLKDIIADCKTVKASKGVCCRCRPISPNTHHWFRRVYKRIGSVLRLLCLTIPNTELNLIRSQDMLAHIMEADSLIKPEGEWVAMTGDISNCYDELDHEKCIQGVQWALANLHIWRGRRTKYSHYTVHRRARRDCTPGPNYNEEDRITITPDQILDVCRFDCTNSIMLVDGKLWRRKLGAPMGGFLSAFYAMLCFAYIEHRCVSPMFRSLGLIGFVKRYMDDVIVVAHTVSTFDRLKLDTFLTYLGSAEVYPPPLKLNCEKPGDQEFLETLISGGRKLTMNLHNKMYADISRGLTDYRRRLGPKETTSARDLSDLLYGIVTRIIQFTSSTDLLINSLLELRCEAIHFGLGDRSVILAIQRAIRKGRLEKRWNEKTLLALRAGSL